MLKSRDMSEKHCNKETSRLIGEVQLHYYGLFLDNYNNSVANFKKKTKNVYSIRYKPICVNTKPEESRSLLQLVHSDNKLLSRILMSLASVCQEVNLLVTEARTDFYQTLVIYGEDSNSGIEHLQKITEFTEKLLAINFFVKRCQQVAVLLLQQLCALLGKKLYANSDNSSFPEPLECLSELLVTLVTLETLLNTGVIKEHWSLYKRTVKSMFHNPAEYGVSLDRLQSLYKCQTEMESVLLSGTIFQNILESATKENVIIAIKNCSIANEFNSFMHFLLHELERDEDSVSFNHLFLQANIIFVFQYHIFGNMDKKVTKRLLDINKKAAACTLMGNVLWYPEEFLLKHMPTMAKILDKKTCANNRVTLISQRSQSLAKDTQQLCLQACLWMIDVQALVKKDKSSFKVEELQDACNLLMDGLKLVKKISEILKWITNLYADQGTPMGKSVLMSLCRLIEVLKGFHFLFQKNLLPLVYITLLISQHLTYKALLILAGIKKNFMQEKSYKEQHLDVISALVIAEHALKGPNTFQRLLVTKLALSASGLPLNNLSDIRTVINRLEIISNVNNLMTKLCDCSFLYWHQVLLSIYFSKLNDPKVDLSRCYLILAALSDCADMAGDKVLVQTNTALDVNLLAPLNQLIETNLRLQTHMHLQLPTSNPFQAYPPNTFKKIQPSEICNEYLNLKQEVEHYLSTMFYNLTTVVLHDWRTYGEMRRLAALEYNLETVDDNLPMQTLEQGLDVLEIMRNIQIFVGKYLYNLNCQVFVEEWSNNKHLNTINISHVANSIRTHGIGIMNTTVNFTYQFLQNKFFMFSQFMFDEHIKSRLLKDMRFFAENKASLNQMYPYERAEKFNFGIRKLGLNQSGLSYLDLFRKLITQIGNAMGYVRLIRSGGRRCLADATCFIKDFQATEELSNLLEAENMPELTKESASCLIGDIKNMVNNFEEATEYFKLLVKAFAPVFRDSRNIHLKNFYMIVPPLTINFVEHSLTCKERLNKKNREGAGFTDDGFAMGLAYIIALLDQMNQLKSLHWFQSVKAKHDQEKKLLETQKSNASKEDDKLQQTLTLTSKRIEAFDNEFLLLYYNYNSARIFFQS